MYPTIQQEPPLVLRNRPPFRSVILAPRLNMVDHLDIVIQDLPKRSFPRVDQFRGTNDRRLVCEILSDPPIEVLGSEGGFVRLNEGFGAGHIRTDGFFGEDVFTRLEAFLDNLRLSGDGESDDDRVDIISSQQGGQAVVPVVDVEFEVDDGFVEGKRGGCSG